MSDGSYNLRLRRLVHVRREVHPSTACPRSSAFRIAASSRVTGPGFYGPYITPGSTRTEENE